MPQRTLRFRIRQDGRVEESVEGVKGEACQLITSKLESALGTLEIQQPTPDAYLSPQEQKQNISAEIH